MLHPKNKGDEQTDPIENHRAAIEFGVLYEESHYCA